uniref:Uncharacterized protein n=1 Tax=Cacopsylla melanoneura TaxID=428564 RepID=A0A8D8Q694_9HEMI
MQATDSFVFMCMIICSVIKQGYFYTEYLLENDKVCSILLKKRTLWLGYENKSGIIVREEKFFQKIGKHALDCTFTVQGGNGGVVAVIQQMKFRTGQTGSGNTSCIDYVQFSPGDKHDLLSTFNIQFKDSVKWSPQYCGEVDLSNTDGKNLPPMETPNGKEVDAYENNPIGQNTYVEPNGAISVKIHIGEDPVDPSDGVTLKIAFTSFQACRYNMGVYKMCGGPMCIWKDYFDDDVVNCPFIDCTDERPCGTDFNDHKLGIGLVTGLGTKVLLGAVAGIFTMVFVLILFFWAFHYCGFLCSTRPPRNLTELTSVPREEDVRPASCTPLTPVLTPSSGEEKDLPPAYETLFPQGPDSGR